jgi:hypothetical protein
VAPPTRQRERWPLVRERGEARTWTWTAGPAGRGGAGRQASHQSAARRHVSRRARSAGAQRAASPTPRSYRAPYATAHAWARRPGHPTPPHPTPPPADVDHGHGGRYGVVGRRARERGRASSTWGFWGFLFFPPFRHVTPPSNPPFPSGRFSSPHPRNPRAGKGNQTRRPVVVSSGPLRCGVPSVRVPPSPPPSRAAVRAAGWGIRGRWCARDRDRVASPPSGGVVVPPGAFARAAAAPTHPRYPTNYKRPTFFLPDRAPGLAGRTTHSSSPRIRPRPGRERHADAIPLARASFVSTGDTHGLHPRRAKTGCYRSRHGFAARGTAASLLPPLAAASKTTALRRA